MRIPYCSFMSFSTSWAEGDTILYGVGANKRYELRVASALKNRRHRNKNPFRSLILSSRAEEKIHFGDTPYHIPASHIRTCKSSLPQFLLCKFSFSWPFDTNAANRERDFVSLCGQSPFYHSDVFFFHVSIFFPAPSSSLPFSTPVFVHTQSAIIPPCRRLWPISECNKLYQFSAIDYR